MRHREDLVTRLQILGSGCTKCRILAEHTEEAARALGLDFTIEKVTAIDEIVASGVMTTPALVVDGVVKVSGHVPSTAAIRAMLT